MPATLDDAQRILRLLREFGIEPVTLLLVPGAGWNPATIDVLRELVDGGAELAGHGWRHRVQQIHGLRHRLHSLLISKDVAEHLALNREAVADLVTRCYGWFEAYSLPAPALYVPPAWAMGALTISDLDKLPFRRYETLTGVYDRVSACYRRLPMVGYEADTRFRALSCRLWNKLNRPLSTVNRPLRVAIHPHDFELRLAGDLRRLLQRGGLAISYRDLNFSNHNGGFDGNNRHYRQ